MQSVYSWMGSPLHLVLEDDLAAAYNRAQDKFKEAQTLYQLEHGTPWVPDSLLSMNWTNEERLAWGKIASVVNLLVEINDGGLDIPEDQCTTDHLIKV